MKVPLAKPEISEADIAAVVDVLRSSQLSQGPITLAFEEELAAYVGVSHAVTVNSGTSALQLALLALEIKEGDEVIAPSFSFMAVTNAIINQKAVPVFVDIDPRTRNTDPLQLATALSEKTRAIVIVHSFGVPALAQQIIEFARHHSLAVIEDACEALGAERDGHKAGALGDIGTLAFYPNKAITTGEGGALLTNSGALAARLRGLRNQGRQPGTEWFQHCEPGFSCRLSDLNCALGLQQLSRIEQILRRRAELAACYKRLLQSNVYISCPKTERGDARVSWFTYPVLLRKNFTRDHRDEIWTTLKQRGIESGRYFAPSHLQPSLRHVPFRCGDLTHTEFISERLLCLPLFPSLTEMQIEFVCESLDEILTHCAGRQNEAHAAVNW
jgi:perosamine synthetase